MALLEFYGKECPHCLTMMPLIEKLEQELGVKVESFETWHDEANELKRREYDNGDRCGGVPYFVNTDSGAKICGAVQYEMLKSWAEAGTHHASPHVSKK